MCICSHIIFSHPHAVNLGQRSSRLNKWFMKNVILLLWNHIYLKHKLYLPIIFLRKKGRIKKYSKICFFYMHISRIIINNILLIFSIKYSNSFILFLNFFRIVIIDYNHYLIHHFDINIVFFCSLLSINNSARMYIHYFCKKM